MKIIENQHEAIKVNFGIWLRSTRRTIDGRPTQRDIAKLAGLSRSHYSQIESGARGTSMDSAISIAKALGFGNEDAVAEIVKLAGHSDIREIQPVIVDITGHGANVGTFTASGQRIALPPEQMNAILTAIGENRGDIDVQDRLGRIERQLDALLNQPVK